MATDPPDFQPGQRLTVERVELPDHLVVTTADGERYRAHYLARHENPSAAAPLRAGDPVVIDAVWMPERPSKSWG
jgi:hypothetical protein